MASCVCRISTSISTTSSWSNTLSVSVVCPDHWFPGDFAVVTSRDGHAFAGEVAGLDMCTGEVTIKLPGS